MNNWNDPGRFERQREARDQFDSSDDLLKQEEIRHVLRQGKTGQVEAVAKPILVLVLIAIGSLGYFTFGPAILSGTNKHIKLGVELAEQGRLHEALVEFDEAIRRDSQVAHAYNYRGNVYGDLSLPERAVQDYNEAIRLAPEFAEAYKNRALVHTVLGHDEDGGKDIDLAVVLGLDPSDLESAIARIKNRR